MNRAGVLQNSPVQQMVAAGGPGGWWSVNAMRPGPLPQPPSPFLTSSPSNSNLFPPPYTTVPPASSSLPSSSNWHEELPPESWSHLLFGGLVGEEEKSGHGHHHHHLSQFQAKKIENWEEQGLQQQQQQRHHQALNLGVKQESSANPYAYAHWSNPAATSSPKSRVISSSAFSSSMLNFSAKQPSNARVPTLPADRSSSECNSSNTAAAATGGALKKARVQPSTSSPSTSKVRKEKLGDRITALHQLVSPFGKTDTASVLLEAIGYIRFLQSQIEALSLPYLGSGSGNMKHQHSVQGERNCIFPEDPGQLLNENCMKRKAAHDQQDSNREEGKDLRSRGLCLVPVACTVQVGSDNGADYWAPNIGGGF